MFQKRMNMIPMSIHVVGCGGTGSRLVPLIVQLIASHPFLSTMTRIFLYDADVVELKNLSRQNFSPADVGKNKALALSARYSKAYGIPVVGVPEYIPVLTNKESRRSNNQGTVGPNIVHLLDRLASFSSDVLPREDYVKATSKNAIWISCVDNLDARISLMNALMVTTEGHQGLPADNCDNPPSGMYSGFSMVPLLHSTNATYSTPSTGPIYIDAGNENTFGQVRICEGIVANSREVLSAYRLAERTIRGTENSESNTNNPFLDIYQESVSLDCYPMFMDPYSLLEGVFSPPQVEASCADLDQTLAVNAQMAIGILSFLQNILLNHPIRNASLYYDLHNGNGQDKLDVSWMERCLGFREGDLVSLAKEHRDSDKSRISADRSFFNMLTEGHPKLTRPVQRINEVITALTAYRKTSDVLPSGAHVEGTLAFAENVLRIISNSGNSNNERRVRTYCYSLMNTFHGKPVINPALKALLMGRTPATSTGTSTDTNTVVSPEAAAAIAASVEEQRRIEEQRAVALSQLRQSGWDEIPETETESEEDEDEN